ncbi:hypothetical protein E4656_13635 [Natronospirillum operosum]|uniref:Uncharacterized protein n=1 Tax=Natronospirillum operosum TaxID=2759953 RepID=A0A4Z0W8Z6_9GAMM|nr:hypothetical protein [Natronospirillum operosum]TGG92508.1 hypothetical protein E4656_13635 [Natronospirillum operosum]
MNTHSDEHIEYWGEVFIKERLYRRRGLPFGVFISDPDAYLKQDAEAGDEVLPFMTAQKATAESLAEAERDDQELLQEDAEVEIAHLPRRNGYVVEQMRHRRYPRRTAGNFWLRQKRKVGGVHHG